MAIFKNVEVGMGEGNDLVKKAGVYTWIAANKVRNFAYLNLGLQRPNVNLGGGITTNAGRALGVAGGLAKLPVKHLGKFGTIIGLLGLTWLVSGSREKNKFSRGDMLELQNLPERAPAYVPPMLGGNTLMGMEPVHNGPAVARLKAGRGGMATDRGQPNIDGAQDLG